MRFSSTFLVTLALVASACGVRPTLLNVERYEGETTGEYIVTLQEDVSKSDFLAATGIKPSHDYTICNGFAAILDIDALNTLRGHADVESISEDGVMQANALVTQLYQARSYLKPQRRRFLVGTPLLYAISIFASLGVFLFGYDQGVMSGIITGPHFISFFGAPGPIEIGTMVSVLEIGAFATSVAAGRIGDIIGRKGTLFIGGVVFSIGGVFQTFAVGFNTMVIGRIVSGFGVGLLSTIVPIYQSEISPPSHRGALACAEFTGNVFGYAFSVWTDYFCSFFNSHMSWRLPLFLQCVIGTMLAVGSMLIPESPRWLIDTDEDDEGLRVLADLHGGDLDDPDANAEFREIKEKVVFERTHGEGRSYVVMWRRYKRRVLLAMSSQAFAQLLAFLNRPAGLVVKQY
ncbi:hypothetical protein H0H93_012365 [Arthromyces matolae]|nr:hypothetical protein H0H93_012365 [Arthromyces matolae]